MYLLCVFTFCDFTFKLYVCENINNTRGKTIFEGGSGPTIKYEKIDIILFSVRTQYLDYYF